MKRMVEDRKKEQAAVDDNLEDGGREGKELETSSYSSRSPKISHLLDQLEDNDVDSDGYASRKHLRGYVTPRRSTRPSRRPERLGSLRNSPHTPEQLDSDTLALGSILRSVIQAAHILMAMHGADGNVGGAPRSAAEDAEGAWEEIPGRDTTPTASGKHGEQSGEKDDRPTSRERRKGRSIIVDGDMNQSGKDSETVHVGQGGLHLSAGTLPTKLLSQGLEAAAERTQGGMMENIDRRTPPPVRAREYSHPLTTFAKRARWTHKAGARRRKIASLLSPGRSSMIELEDIAQPTRSIQRR